MVSVDLLADSYVSTVGYYVNRSLTNPRAVLGWPRINTALNDYAVDIPTDTIDGASALVFPTSCLRVFGSDGRYPHINPNCNQACYFLVDPTTASTSVRSVYGIFLSG